MISAATPCIRLSFCDLANPYTPVEIRGTAEMLPDEGKRLPYGARAGEMSVTCSSAASRV